MMNQLIITCVCIAISTYNFNIASAVNNSISCKYFSNTFKLIEHVTTCSLIYMVPNLNTFVIVARMCVYFVYDIYVTMLCKEMDTITFIHHFGALFMYMTYKYNDIENVIRDITLFEVSSIFLALRTLRPGPIANIGFVVTFIYFRLYRGFYKTITPYMLENDVSILYKLIYALIFPLHIHWTILLLKKILRSMRLN